MKKKIQETKKKQTPEPWNGEARREKNKREDTIINYINTVYLFI